MSRKTKIFWLIVISFLVLTPNVHASEPRLALSIDRPNVSIDDSISIQITVEGKSFVSHPELYGAEYFNIRSAGTSSQMQIINGRMSSSKVFSYILIPKRVGAFTVGPAILNVGGKEYQSNSVVVTVNEGRQVVQEDRIAYMTASVSKSKPFVGEQLVYTTRFYTRAGIQNAQLDMPEFTGFWKEQLGDVKNVQQVINGQLWQVSEIKFALFPLSTGKLTIEKSSLTADIVIADQRPSARFSSPFFSSFYDTERRTYRSKALGLNVEPLPSENRPANFSNLVGSFSLKQQIGSTELEAGESTTLTVTVQGNGDLKKLKSPELKNGSNFKVYDDEPRVDIISTGSGLKETKIFKKALVPLSPGKLTLPPFTLSYFDPKKEEYVTIATEQIVLDVKPSSNPEKIVVSSGDGRGILKKELEVLGDDLMPIFKDISAIKSDAITHRALILYIVLSCLPIVIFILSLAYYFRQQRLRADSGYIKRGKAYRRSQKQIKKLTKSSSDDFYTNTSLILRDYIGDKLSIDGRSLTAADICRRLEPAGASTTTCEKIVNFFNKCDAGLYGGKVFDDNDRKAMSNELTAMIKSLEKEFRHG